MKLWDRFWWFVPLLIIVSASIAAVTVLNPPKPKPVAKTVPIPTCMGTNETSFSCWQKRYQKVVTTQSPEAAMAALKADAHKVPYVNSNCHQMTHVIGRASAQIYVSVAATYKHGDNYCWSGYYHGAIETIAQKIGSDKILSQINSVCADLAKEKQYGFDHFNCVHGMGHGLMAIQDDQLFTALKSCDSFEGNWQQESCYGGVFMENVMDAIHHPLTGSPYLKTDDPIYPCNAVEDRYKEQCFLMQTSHMLSVEGGDYSKVFALCATVDAPYNDTCDQSLGRDASGNSSSNQATTIEHCELGATTEAKKNCFTGAVKDFMSYYHSDKQAYAMCAAIPEPELAASCHADGEAYYKIF